MLIVIAAIAAVAGILASISTLRMARIAHAERDEALARAEAAEQALADRTEELRGYSAELERSNADLAQFAYVASHDLSEPLRTVSSFVRLLQQRYAGQLDERADEFIGYAVSGTARMQRLIDDLLSFSRAGRAELAAEPVSLDAVLRETKASLASILEREGGTLQIDELPVVQGDERQLGSVFQNLVSNALKFHVPGEPPRVEVRSRRAGEDWEVQVVDHGIGIDPDAVERIFKMFQRLHGREAYEGTGIGLAIVDRIVERHGGRVRVHETSGGGSTFTVVLPAGEGETPPAYAGASSRSAGSTRSA